MIFADDRVFVHFHDRERGVPFQSLYSVGEGGAEEVAACYGTSSVVGKGLVCWETDEGESSVLLELSSGERFAVPDESPIGYSIENDSPIVEFRNGRYHLGSRSYESLDWRTPDGCGPGSVIDGRYFGAWAQSGQVHRGCVDVPTGERIWDLEGLSRCLWWEEDEALVALIGGESYYWVATADGKVLRQAPKKWLNSPLLVMQGGYAASGTAVHTVAGELVASFPDSRGPIALTEGLAWFAERKRPFGTAKDQHFIVCYDLDKREEVWRKKLATTGINAFANYGFCGGRFYMLRAGSLECYG